MVICTACRCPREWRERQAGTTHIPTRLCRTLIQWTCSRNRTDRCQAGWKLRCRSSNHGTVHRPDCSSSASLPLLKTTPRHVSRANSVYSPGGSRAQLLLQQTSTDGASSSMPCSVTLQDPLDCSIALLKQQAGIEEAILSKVYLPRRATIKHTITAAMLLLRERRAVIHSPVWSPCLCLTISVCLHHQAPECSVHRSN